MGCAFTDPTSSRDGKPIFDCDAARCAVFITCLSCEPPQRIKRCTTCYKKFQKKIAQRLPQITRHSNGSAYMTSEIKGLLEIDFSALAEGRQTCELARNLIVMVDGVWQWRGRCPCCYSFVVPEVKCQMVGGFKDMEPRVLKRELIDFEPRQLTMPDGFIDDTRVKVRLDFILLATLISYEQEQALRYFAADPPTHDNYLVLWQRPAACEGRELWRLVVAEARDGDEARMLSLMRFDYLSGLWKDVAAGQELGAALLYCIRAAAPMHKKGAAPSAVLRDVLDSSIRVNRIAGPFGMMTPGTDFRSYVLNGCDQRVTGATPRRWTASIAIGIQSAGGAITGLPIFYIGVKCGRNSAVAVPRHHAIPRRGFVANGTRLFDSIRQHKRQSELVELTRRFTKTTYDGALLVADLAVERPDLPFASKTAVQTTLRNYETHLNHFNGGAPVASRTRSQVAEVYCVGQAVFAKWGRGEDELWWPATVEKVHRHGETCRISYADSDEEDEDAKMKPVARIRPDVVGLGTMENKGLSDRVVYGMQPSQPRLTPDPEEDVDATAAALAERIAARRADPELACLFTFLDVLLEAGEYTALLELIFGHEDHFGTDTSALVENKLLLPEGRRSLRKLSRLPERGPVPEGALGIPRVKVATICGAMQDVELHELHGIFHAGRSVQTEGNPGGGGGGGGGSGGGGGDGEKSQSAAAKRRRKDRQEEVLMKAVVVPRSCWQRTADGTCGWWYPEGVGVADWLSKMNH